MMLRFSTRLLFGLGVWGVGLLGLSLLQPAEARRGWGARSTLTLDGSSVSVFWSDGDSFRVLRGRNRGLRARLKGFNTLESYGPVHKWGKWKAGELARNAHQATKFVRKGHWNCRTEGKKDRYNRMLVSCPDLAKALLQRGLAHLFGTPTGELRHLLAVQRDAQKRKVGMWAKGVPSHVLSSVHSTSEGQNPAYNRLLSTKDGVSTLVRHRNRYRTCEWVCLKGSCLLYVPYKQRYGRRRASCLRYRSDDADDDDE